MRLFFLTRESKDYFLCSIKCDLMCYPVLEMGTSAIQPRYCLQGCSGTMLFSFYNWAVSWGAYLRLFSILFPYQPHHFPTNFSTQRKNFSNMCCPCGKLIFLLQLLGMINGSIKYFSCLNINFYSSHFST